MHHHLAKAHRNLLPLLIRRPKLGCLTAGLAAATANPGVGLGLGLGLRRNAAAPYMGVVSRGYNSTATVCMDGVSSWNTDTYKDFGQNVFRGDVSTPYLMKHGLDGDVLEKSDWAKEKETADKVS